MNPWDTPTACITYANTTLSRKFATYFASRGYSLLLTGLDRNKLKSTAETLRWEFQVSVNIAILDLSNPSNVANFIKHWIVDTNIEVLINNTQGTYMDETLLLESETGEHQQKIIHSNMSTLCKAAVDEFSIKSKGILISIATLPGKIGESLSTVNNRTFLHQLHKTLTPALSEHVQLQLLTPYPEENMLFKYSEEQWEERVIRESIKGIMQNSSEVKIKGTSLIGGILSQFLPLKQRQYRPKARRAKRFSRF